MKCNTPNYTFSQHQKKFTLVDVKKQGASEDGGYPYTEEKSLQSIDMKKKQKVRSGPSSNLAEVEGDICHLLGKPFFDVVLTKSHVTKSCVLTVAANIAQLLPRATVPIVLRYRDEDWSMSYIGDSGRPRFSTEWKTFLTENKLKCGDACVFELTENSSKKLKFKVHVLRGDLPPELQAAIDFRGWAMDSPIIID